MTVTGDVGGRSSATSFVVRLLVVGGLLTVVVVATPGVPLAFPAPALQVMIETLTALVALLVAFLCYGRHRDTRRLQDLLLGLGLATVAVANLVLTALPDALAIGRAEEVDRWAPLVVRLVSSVLLAAAALVPRATTTTPRTAAGTAGGLLALVVGVAVAGATWGQTLPPVVTAATTGDARPLLVAHPVALVAHCLTLVLLALAAGGFARGADRAGDGLLRWMAATSVLSALARLHYLLVPTLYTDAVFTGDVLRTAAYGCMLVGATQEIGALWRARATSAVLEDRRRVARDLHDGVLQELAYITAQSRRLAAVPGDERAVARIAGAAGRATEESRRALVALTATADEPFLVLLARSLDDLASRHDVRIVARVDEHAVVEERTGDALLRIVGESVANAVRHGHAHRIDVTLSARPLVLTVRDDGAGFLPLPDGTGRAGGFGLRSMRERAEAVGGMLHVASVPGAGTTVEVRIA